MARTSIIARASTGFAMTLTTLFTMAQAEAQTANGGADGARAACRADYQKFCSTTMPGGGRIAKCLAENSEKLSPACKTAMADAKASKAGGAK
jgi:hypothetical protein